MKERGCTFRSGMELLVVSAFICVIATNSIASEIEYRHGPIVGGGGGGSANDGRGYSGTYVHLGRKAATIWAS
jgi:hypothetical protein